MLAAKAEPSPNYAQCAYACTEAYIESFNLKSGLTCVNRCCDQREGVMPCVVLVVVEYSFGLLLLLVCLLV